MGNKQPKLEEGSSNSSHQRHSLREGIKKINDVLYLFYEPEPAKTANLDIFFFHGLDCEFQGADVEDAYILTWRSIGELEEVWPRKWLPEDFPQARIISVYYDCSTRKADLRGRLDLYEIGLNILVMITEFQEERGHIPVILVGHGFGGIVMKQLCIDAQSRAGDSLYDRFLKSIRGLYFYDTPHLGVHWNEAPVENEAEPLGWMRSLSVESTRLHESFIHLRSRYCWTIFELGGTRWTGPFKVAEASSRYGEDYRIVDKDHLFTCRPHDRSDRTYVHLKELIGKVLRQVEEENIRRRGKKLNEYVYELYKPIDGPVVDILFFHGLNLNSTTRFDIHISTWTSGEGREAHVWPTTWLSQDFPRARILAISYDSHLITTAEEGTTDLHNLLTCMTSLLLEREVSPMSPLILVGHCLGGVLIKQLCIHAHDRQGEGAQMETRTELTCFLKKIKAILFLGTPHHGMTLPGLQEATRGESSPLVKDVEVFNAGAARLHERFDRLRREYKWRIAGVGEQNKTKWGESLCVMVPKASARYGEFTSVQADHISLTKPMGKQSHVYIRLKMLIEQNCSRINECLSLFYEPEPANTANLDMFFFHGLDFEFQGSDVENADILTWRSTGEPEEVWPQTWLPKDFPKARIISLRYNCSTEKTDRTETRDLNLIAESLLGQITRFQREGCFTPVILVGHGFGGIVVKYLCKHAHSRVGNDMYDVFLKSVRGFYFYDTPHLGMAGIKAPIKNEGKLLGWMRPGDRESEVLHADFQALHRRYRWIIFGLGEAFAWSRFSVPEVSSNYGGDYIKVREDHLFTCRPHDRSDRTYVHLKELIGKVLRQVEEENIRRCGEKLNDYVYELHKPIDGPAEMDVLFFHGLNLNSTASNDIHVSTWTSGEGREAHLWPTTWLSQDFPRVRILAISYDSHLITTAEQGRTDLHNAAESLMTCLLLEREALLMRPLILVGHCFGGVLIKQLCIHAHDRQGEGAQMETRTHLRCFLKKIKAILFLGTPHHGMTFPGLQEAVRGESSPLIKDVEVFNPGAARLHERFDRLRREYKWRIAGVGELNETKWGEVLSCIVIYTTNCAVSQQCQGESRCVMVPEASARYGEFTSVQADHISISKPTGKHSHVYIRLMMLIEQPSSRECTPGNEEIVPPIASELVAFQVVQAQKLLKNSTCLGFYGMGGIGKSTLARLVFNRLNQEFEYSCFVSDVKLKTGITHEDVLHKMHHYGEKMECTWGHLRGRRVLIVLDDVDKYEDLKILGYIASQVSSKEDRYIVTSRDLALLGTLGGILHPREVELYRVPPLDESSARKLLLSYEVPDPPAEEFVDKVVQLCNGLPLSLEVIGKYLHGNKGKEKIWEKSIDALHNCENIQNFKKRLWDILQFSYDRLADEAKEIFLDCASFFVGSSWRLREAKVAWQSRYSKFTDELESWKSLVNTSLVYDVKDDDSIQMHEQMKDLGTKLAMCSGDGGKYSRTWNEKILSEALGTLSTEHRRGGGKSSLERSSSYQMSSSGKTSRKQVISVSRQLQEPIKAVIALRLEEPMPITMEDISKMTALRYLDSSKDLTPMFGKRIPCWVVLLRWRGQFASIADVFDPEEMNVLAVLHLEAPMLYEVPDSFGFLPRLQILTFIGCKFNTLPDSFGYLPRLQRLEFTNCTELCSLPESFGYLENLEFLSFSVADMYGEKRSEAGEQNFLPESFGDLVKLKILTLYGCRSLHALPGSFSKLKSLEELRIGRCNNLLTLSELFGELPELRTFDVFHCRSLPEVPVSFGKLPKLRAVCISDCESFQAFPETLGDLVNLESLVIDCKSLHQLPRTLGQLSKLQKLEICGTEVDELPTTVSSLRNLQQLYIVKNEKLRSLPNFGDLSLQQHSVDLSGNPRSLSQLRHLSIIECDHLDVLHTSLGHLQALRRLEISRCRRVRGLPDSVEHLSQLEELELIDCERICSLPDNFGNLTSLETLVISLCSIRALPDSFSNLRNLRNLSLLKCPLTDLPKEFGNLARLETLILRDCNVSILPDSLSNLVNLKELDISNCPYLTHLPESFGNITSLTKLTVNNCGVSILPDSFCKLLKLDELVILSCPLNDLPSDFQKLVALRLLTLIEVPWTSVPTCIKCLPSLHTLTVKLPELTDECEWLGQGLSTLRSYNRFSIRNGEFHLIQE